MSILGERLRRTPDIVAASAAIEAAHASKLKRAISHAQLCDIGAVGVRLPLRAGAL
jgi:hypothetical protein